MGSVIHKLLSKPFLVLSFSYIIVSLLVYSNYGVKIVNDSERYLGYATNLKQGFYFDSHNFWYFTYALYIYCVRLIWDTVPFIVFSQYVLGLTAVFALYKTYFLLFHDKTGAFITCLTYILFVEIVSWNSYILCESLFCSLTCFSFYFLARLFTQPITPKLVALSSSIILLTLLTKPTGIALLGAMYTLFFFSIWKKTSSKIKKGCMISISLAIALLLINRMLTTFLLVENYNTGDIIYAASTIPELASYSLLVITPPEDLFIPSIELAPIVRLISFILHNPLFWLQLFVLKIFYFVAHIRPYWSFKHNIFVVLALFPYYYFTFKTLYSKELYKKVALFSVSYFLFHTLIIGITSVDWDGRFLMPLLPLFFILGTYNLLKLSIKKQIVVE